MKRQGDRPPLRADHPGRGPHVRHGRAVPDGEDLLAARPDATRPVDRELLLSYKESEQGQILHEGITEAGSMASMIAAGHGVRHARRAHDPVLHLLLDVRLPAHRRPDVGARRPDGPRASCSAPPPAAPRSTARACSTRTATRRCSPRRTRRASPTTRRGRTRSRHIVQDGLRRMYGERAARTSSTT